MAMVQARLVDDEDGLGSRAVMNATQWERMVSSCFIVHQLYPFAKTQLRVTYKV